MKMFCFTIIRGRNFHLHSILFSIQFSLLLNSAMLQVTADLAPHWLDQSLFKHLFPFRPSAGRNPDWSITMIFMQLTTQLIHDLICIIICYKPKGNIIILLCPLELKSDFISIETP